MSADLVLPEARGSLMPADLALSGVVLGRGRVAGVLAAWREVLLAERGRGGMDAGVAALAGRELCDVGLLAVAGGRGGAEEDEA